MPLSRVPKMSNHKASGQAVVRLGGKDYYLGAWGSPSAATEYGRLIAEWLAGGRQALAARKSAITVVEIIAAFWDWAGMYYRFPDGSPSPEIASFREALRPLRRLYGHTSAEAFGPLALKAVRQDMIDSGLCRTNINRRIGRVKRVFKWAVENEMISPTVFHGLQAVAGLKAGRCGARESEPVKPVAGELVDAVLPFVSRQVAAMIRLQLLTGMRPGEVVTMRGIDIDMGGPVWIYRPGHHKTRHLGHDRMIFFGPKAKEIIRQFLKPDLTAYLFSPADADIERRGQLHLARKTPMSCGNIPGSNVKRKPLKKPHDHYSVRSYSRAINYGCQSAFPLPEHLQPQILENGRRETGATFKARLTPAEKIEIKAWRKDHNWHPHQLRHSAATNLRKTYGLEPAQVILGHKTLTVTQVYAERNIEAAMRIMAEVG